MDERIAALKPRSLNFAQAAALPLTSITARELLFDRLGIVGGDATRKSSLLIIGGVGSIMIQLARKLTGLTVIATASRLESRDWVLKPARIMRWTIRNRSPMKCARLASRRWNSLRA